MSTWVIISDCMDNQLLSRMQTLCSRREYCTKDIMAKLNDCQDMEEVIASLRKDKYLDDSRYAKAFTRDKSSLAGWGPVKIRFALSSKGISKQDIETALGEIDEVKAEDKLEKTLIVKYKAIQDNPDCRLKLIRFALGRGYEWEQVSPLVDKILKNGNL